MSRIFFGGDDFWNAPKISVIIPLYNAERFIRQCLVSVLASKLKDYEVLVVDDCSTDNSVAEVEKILPHFDGRLKILSTEKNSGGAGIPRNVGIKNAAGKYVTFVDNDDFILPTALENFFEVAEIFQADVVHTEMYFAFKDAGNSNFTRKDLTLEKYEAGEFVCVPTLESADLRERIRRYTDNKFFWVPWGKFYRREFLTENKIDFPQMRFSEDMVFCFKCLCLAEKYLRAPLVTNINRVRKGSNSQYVFSPREGSALWLSVMTTAVNLADEFMNGLEFFRANPDVRNSALKFFIDKHFSFHKNIFRELQPHEVQKIFYDELQNPALDANGKNLVAAYLYAEQFSTK